MKQFFLTTAASIALSTPALADGHAHSATSLQSALDAAAASGGPSVVMVGNDIALNETLRYTGADPLTLVGTGQTLQMGSDATVFEVTNGANVNISGLNFVGIGGFSIQNQGGAGKGIFVAVPATATGTVQLNLTDVMVKGVSNHGIHISDCSLADACGGGSGGAGEGSAASIAVHLNNVTIDDAGNGKFDADGLRVDERSIGDITMVAANSTFINVGADGVELDEGQAGNVIVTVTGSRFNANGNYCDPAVIGGFMPDEDEGEFEQGQRQEADIPGAITGSPDDSCFEREVDLYDDGSVEEYEFGIDLDDGFDIDEAGPGSLHASITDSVIRANLDEGIDFDEEDAGSIRTSFVRTVATGNTDDGFKSSEEGEGHIEAVLMGVISTDNGGKGIVFEEADAGDFALSALGATTSGNDDSEDTGMELVQEDDGVGNAMVAGSSIVDGIDAEGVELN